MFIDIDFEYKRSAYQLSILGCNFLRNFILKKIKMAQFFAMNRNCIVYIYRNATFMVYTNEIKTYGY